MVRKNKSLKSFIGIFMLLFFLYGGIELTSCKDFLPEKDLTEINYTLSEDKLVVSYSFVTPIINKRENIVGVSIEGLYNVMVPEKPILPTRVANILLPENKKIKDVTTIYRENQKILIASGEVKIAEDPIFIGDTLDRTIGDENVARVDSENYKFNLTDWKIGKKNQKEILSISLYPVLYNLEKKEFYFYENIDVVVEFEKDLSVKFASYRNENILYNEDLLKIVDNGELTASLSEEEFQAYSLDSESSPSYDYIIITSEFLENCTEEYNFQALLSQKQNRIANQLSGRIVTVESIINNSTFYCDGEFGDGCNIDALNDTAAKIRNFIKYAEQNLSTEYVLLGGDVSIIPNRSFYVYVPNSHSPKGYYDEHIPSDMYYSNLDGSMNANNDSYWGWTYDNPDFYSDVYVGRAPVETCEQLNNFVRKTILYENLTINRSEYIKNALSVYDSSISTLTTPTNYLEKYNYSVHSQGTTELGWIQNYINGLSQDKLPSIINSAGHGWINYLSAYGSFSNTNNSYPNFFYSQACWTGAFDYSDSFAEQLVYNQNSSYAVLMNSRYGWYSPSNENSYGGAFMNEFWYQIFYNDISNLAKANQISKERFIGKGDYYKWLYWTQNLFGDPEISIYFYPSQINLSVVFKSPRPNYYYNNDTLLVEVSCTNCTNSWWSNGSSNYSSPGNFSFSGGNNTIYAYANDSYGNVISQNVSFFIDLEPPNVTKENISGDFKRLTTVSFELNFSDDYGISEEIIESDLSGEYINYSLINATEILPTETNYNYTLTSNSSNFSYRFYAIDLAGNIVSTELQTIEILNTPPSFNESYSVHPIFLLSNYSINKSLLFSDVDPQILNISVFSSINLSINESLDEIVISAINYSVRSGLIELVANDSENQTYQNLSIDFYSLNITLPSSKEGPEIFIGNFSRENISELDVFQNVPLRIISQEHGRINFSEVNITSREINFSNRLNISYHRVEINSSALPFLNISATVSLNNVSFTNATIFKDGSRSACVSECSNIEHNRETGVFSFSVSGFSSYLVGEATCIDGVQNCHDGFCEEGIDCGGRCVNSCSPQPTSSGSPGGSSGGGISSPVRTISPEGFEIYIELKKEVKIKVKQKEHRILVNSLNETSANVTIYSTPKTIILEKGIEKLVDLDDDGLKDLSLELMNVSKSEARIFLKEVLEEELLLEEDLTDSVISPWEEDFKEKSLNFNWNYVFVGILFLLLFIFNLKRVHRLIEKSMKNRLNKSCLYLYEGKKFIVHSNYLLLRIYLFVFRKSSLKPYADKFFGEMCDYKLIKVKPLFEIKKS